MRQLGLARAKPKEGKASVIGRLLEVGGDLTQHVYFGRAVVTALAAEIRARSVPIG
jgi:hypothetical protein